jgi:hypothetical protein
MELVSLKTSFQKRLTLLYHTIAKTEAGATPSPTIETVKKGADVLGVSLDNLMK